MASGALLDRMRQLYTKAEADLKSWAALQEEGQSLLGTISNIAARLPAIEDRRCYGALASAPGVPPGLPARLLAKQLAALEGLIVQLQEAVEGMAAAGLQRQAQQAQQAVQGDRGLTPAARARTAGPIPSADQCVQGLQDIWRMHAAELAAKQALVDQIRFDTEEAALRAAAALWAAQPHIDAARVRDLLYVVAATREPRRL